MLVLFFQLTGVNIESMRSKLAVVKEYGKALLHLESVTSNDKVVIKRQLKILSKLWDDVCHQTKLRLRHMIELLENIEKAEEVWKLLDQWLSTNETLLMKQNVAGNAHGQKDLIQQVRLLHAWFSHYKCSINACLLIFSVLFTVEY